MGSSATWRWTRILTAATGRIGAGKDPLASSSNGSKSLCKIHEHPHWLSLTAASLLRAVRCARMRDCDICNGQAERRGLGPFRFVKSTRRCESAVQCTIIAIASGVRG